MDELNRLETDVEEFLPRYYLPDDECVNQGALDFYSVCIAGCAVLICGLFFFVWSTMISENNAVVAGGDGDIESSSTINRSLGIAQEMSTDSRR